MGSPRSLFTRDWGPCVYFTDILTAETIQSRFCRTRPTAEMRQRSVAAFLLLAIIACDSARILIYPVGHCYNSLLLDMEKLAHFLSTSGHDVTLLINSGYEGTRSSLDMSAVHVATYPDVSVRTMCDLETTLASGSASMSEITDVWMQSTYRYCDSLLGSRVLETLDRSFDLLIADRSDWCSAIVSDYLHSVPLVLFASVSVSFNYDELSRYVHVPSIFLAQDYPLSRTDRLTNTLLQLLIYVSRPLTLDPVEGLRHKYNMSRRRSLPDVYDSAYVTLLNSDQLLDHPRPLYAHEVEVGFLFAELSPREISCELTAFLHQAKDVLVISFGSQISRVNANVNDIILHLVDSLPEVKVVWKTTESVSRPNLYAASWIPQGALLATGSVSLLITHGGLASTTEAIYFGVPMLILPMQQEQLAQALKLSDYLGVAAALDLTTLNASLLLTETSRLLTRSGERDAVRALSASAHSKVTRPSDLLLYWVRRITETGLERPRRPSSQTSLVAWLLIDVLCITASVTISLIAILALSAYMIIPRVFRAVRPLCTLKG